jgi:uncharacterized membrane protein YjjP (DUF1212 family)
MLRLAEALHRYGAPAHRLEDVTKLMARKLGVEGQFAALPTSFFASFGHLEKQHTYLVRVESAELNLDKQTRLDRVVTDVADGRTGPEEGERLVDEIIKAPAPYGPAITTVCWGVSSGVAARYFGGGWREMTCSAFIGILVGVLSTLLARSHQTIRVFEIAATALASVLAVVGAAVLGPLSTSIALLGGVVVLLPGYTLTVALNELATRHLVTGTGRLMGAVTVLLVMGVGVALGDILATLFFGPEHMWIPITLAPWTEAVALLFGMCAYVVTLRVPLREAPFVVFGGIVTYATAHIGAELTSPQAGVGMAALMLGLYGNLYSRYRNAPSSITITPAIMYLVPGSIGLRSLFSLMEKNVISGIEGAFQMTMIAISIVAGLLLSNVLLQPKRVL